MNKYNSLLLILFLLLGACKEEASDFDIKRNNIVGTWEVTQATQEIRADTLHSEYSSSFEMTFYEGGTGVKPIFFLIEGEQSFEWLYQYSPEKVVIKSNETELEDFKVLGHTEFYTVSKNEPDRQIWEFEVRPIGGVADVYQHTWKMDRK